MVLGLLLAVGEGDLVGDSAMLVVASLNLSRLEVNYKMSFASVFVVNARYAAEAEVQSVSGGNEVNRPTDGLQTNE